MGFFWSWLARRFSKGFVRDRPTIVCSQMNNVLLIWYINSNITLIWGNTIKSRSNSTGRPNFSRTQPKWWRKCFLAWVDRRIYTAWRSLTPSETSPTLRSTVLWSEMAKVELGKDPVLQLFSMKDLQEREQRVGTFSLDNFSSDNTTSWVSFPWGADPRSRERGILESECSVALNFPRASRLEGLVEPSWHGQEKGHTWDTYTVAEFFKTPIKIYRE